MLSEKCIMHTASIDIYGLMMRGYYFTSMCIIVISIFIFLWSFEKRKPKTREIVTLAVMTALAVVGRLAFFYDTSGKALCSHYYNNGSHVRKAVRILMWSPYGFCIRIFLWAGPMDTVADDSLWLQMQLLRCYKWFYPDFSSHC